VRYSIHGFSQPRAVELGLSNDDLLVLRWFVDFCGTGKMQSVVEPDGIYYWVNYQSVLDDLPVLQISKDRLYRKHFKALCDAQVLRHKHIKGGGSFSYYGYSVNYETLVYSTPTVKLPEGTVKIPDGTAEIPNPSDETTAAPVAELPHPSGEITGTKINLPYQSIIDPLIKKSESMSGGGTSSALEKRFDVFWMAYPKKVGKRAAETAWKKIKPDAALHDRIMTAIGRARATEQWTKENGRFIPNPTTWLNQGRWDDEYEEASTRDNESKHFTLSGFKPATDHEIERKHDVLAGFKRV